ncbi:MAG: hypothetical protein ABI670_07850 [Chloroflexota bacterium]
MMPRLYIILLTLLPMLAGCSQPLATGDATAATVDPVRLEIVELPELKQPQEVALKDNTSVTWTRLSSIPPPDQRREMKVQQAIQTEADRLAKVDYAALSIPQYVTVTHSLQITPDAFDGSGAVVEQYGEAAGERRWALYAWRGPDIPQLPNRLIVFRWVEVYAVYDLAQEEVVRLLATVRGEVHE